MTGSSDAHGTNKTVQVGADTTDPKVYEQILNAASGTAPITTAVVCRIRASAKVRTLVDDGSIHPDRWLLEGCDHG